MIEPVAEVRIGPGNRLKIVVGTGLGETGEALIDLRRFEKLTEEPEHDFHATSRGVRLSVRDWQRVLPLLTEAIEQAAAGGDGDEQDPRGG